MLTWREVFHKLANKQNLAMVGLGAIKEELNFLLEKRLSKELRDELQIILSDLDKVIKGAEETNLLIEEIKKEIYKKVKPESKFNE